MNQSIFSANFKETPFWWERTPRPDEPPIALPNSADVVIIGSGYTGLSAALQTAKHGRHTVVLDAEDAGWGCSSRNGGHVTPSIKPSFALLEKRYGRKAALEIYKDGNKALNWVESFSQNNNIDCSFNRVGRFFGADSAKTLDSLRASIKNLPEELDIDPYIVEREYQHYEIGTDYYHGGVIYPHHASLDPAAYHQGLLKSAKLEGAEVVTHCIAENIEKCNGYFEVKTSRGTIAAKDVVVATSGYTSKLTPWQQRRIIPIGSYMIATEPLAGGLLDKLMPKKRVITDTMKLVVYYRPCPENKRILFGGRVSLKETNPTISAPKLRTLLLQRFPEMESVKITHSWMGFVGYTFDTLPHIGKHGGIYYSMGYCGSGISMASYCGMKTGLKVIGDPAGEMAIDRLKFPSRPYYRGNPWFLAPSIFYCRWRDNRKSKRP